MKWLDASGGWKRIWKVDECLCGVIELSNGNWFIGFIDYPDGHKLTTARKSKLSEAIDDVQRYVDSPPSAVDVK